MLEGLRSVPGDSVLPFVLQFYGNSSSYLWDDNHGTTHEIRRAERGDPLMALFAVQSQFLPNEWLMAFHDNVYAVSEPEDLQIAQHGGHVPTDHDLFARNGCKNSGKFWWMMKFHYREALTPVLLMKLLYSRLQRDVRIWVNRVFILISLKTEIARSVNGPILQGPRAEDAMANPYFEPQILVT